MSNNVPMNQEDRDKERKKKALEDTAYMLKNRMGATPMFYGFIVNNRMVEKCIENMLESEGVDLQAEQVGVRCSWERDFEGAFRTGKTGGGIIPFHTFVVTRVRNKEPQKAGTTAMQRVMNRITKNMQNSKKMHFSLLNRPALNKALEKFMPGRDEHPDVVWSRCEEHNHKTNICICELSFEKVLNYIFSVNPDDPSKKEVGYDVYDFKAQNDKQFTLVLVKSEIQDNYKNSGKDYFRQVAIKMRR